MDSTEKGEDKGRIDALESGIGDLKEKVTDVEPVKIGAEAQELDLGLTVSRRMRLLRSTLRRLWVLVIIYIIGMLGMILFFGGQSEGLLPLFPSIILIALLFELMDSAAGMGFGTALAPLLFIFGYSPLQVTPVLLISETVTGIVSSGVHHELKNA